MCMGDLARKRKKKWRAHAAVVGSATGFTIPADANRTALYLVFDNTTVQWTLFGPTGPNGNPFDFVLAANQNNYRLYDLETYGKLVQGELTVTAAGPSSMLWSESWVEGDE